MYNETVHVWCERCGDNFPMRQSTHDRLEESGDTFYCPKGHSMILDRKIIVVDMRNNARRAKRYSDTIDKLRKTISSMKGVQVRHRNRLLRGDCPYCGKSPSNLAAHIAVRHHKPKGK